MVGMRKQLQEQDDKWQRDSKKLQEMHQKNVDLVVKQKEQER